MFVQKKNKFKHLSNRLNKIYLY